MAWSRPLTRQADRETRLRAAGWRKLCVWLDPPAQAALARLRAGTAGASHQELVRWAILELDERREGALGHHGPKARDR